MVLGELGDLDELGTEICRPSRQRADGHAWDESIAAVRRDRAEIKAIVTDSTLDLTDKIPWGDGQTYLRTILLAADHSAYHVGQLIAVRRMLDAWPAA